MSKKANKLQMQYLYTVADQCGLCYLFFNPNFENDLKNHGYHTVTYTEIEKAFDPTSYLEDEYEDVQPSIPRGLEKANIDMNNIPEHIRAFFLMMNEMSEDFCLKALPNCGYLIKVV